MAALLSSSPPPLPHHLPPLFFSSFSSFSFPQVNSGRTLLPSLSLPDNMKCKTPPVSQGSMWIQSKHWVQCSLSTLPPSLSLSLHSLGHNFEMREPL